MAKSSTPKQVTVNVLPIKLNGKVTVTSPALKATNSKREIVNLHALEDKF